MLHHLRSVPSIRWLGLAALLALGGCAQPGGQGGGTPFPQGGTSGAQRTADGRDIVTASDRTDLDRRADVHMELAREYYKNGQFTTALDEVKQTLAARPERADAYMLRGLIYGALGEASTADESFQRSLQLRPRDGDTMHNYGWFLCQVRRYGDADAQFVAAAQAPGYTGQVRSALAQGICQARAGDLATAEKTLSHAFELDPINPYAAYNLADVLYRRGQFDRARFYIRRVNTKDELVTAQSLWLAARIERKLSNDDGVQALGKRLHERFPQAAETAQFDRNRFDD